MFFRVQVQSVRSKRGNLRERERDLRDTSGIDRIQSCDIIFDLCKIFSVYFDCFNLVIFKK